MPQQSRSGPDTARPLAIAAICTKQDTGFRLQASGFRNRLQVSGFRLQVSGTGFRF